MASDLLGWGAIGMGTPILTDKRRGKLRVIPIKTELEFFGMQRAWNELLSKSRADTVFLTWEWLTAWWRAYGKNGELYILRVIDDDETIGLAPFYRKTISKYGFSFQVLALIGDGSADSDYLDWISEQGDEEIVARSLINFLVANTRFWDIILLNEIPETSLHHSFLRNLAQDKGWYYAHTIVPCAYVNLPSDWETYLRSLKPRMRTKVRSLMKHFEQIPNVRFDLCTHPDQIESRLQSLFALHTDRWRKVGEQGVFGSEAKQQFYLNMSKLFLSQGWLRFYSLAVDCNYLAHQFCFQYKQTIFLLQEGFDPKWDAHAPGNVLRAHVLRDSIQRDLLIYDFLAGVTPHKLSWGCDVKRSLRLSVALPKFKTKIFFGLPLAVQWTKEKLKTILPETVLEWAISLKQHVMPKRKRHLGPHVGNE